MEWFVRWIRENTDWLYTKIYQNQFFFFDFWSFAHLWAGIGAIIIFTFFGFKHRILILFSILFLYEACEVLLVYIALNVFKPEIIKDQLTDIFVGLLGGLIGLYLLKTEVLSKISIFKHETLLDATAVFTSLLIAFFWVGSYGYQYDISFFNSAGINWWAFMLWALWLTLIVELYELFKKYLSKFIKCFVLVWFTYCVLMLLYENLGYNIFKIHEINHSESGALIFNLIHGTKALHVFYLTAPLVIIGIYIFFLKVFSTARRKELLRIIADGKKKI